MRREFDRIIYLRFVNMNSNFIYYYYLVLKINIILSNSTQMYSICQLIPVESIVIQPIYIYNLTCSLSTFSVFLPSNLLDSLFFLLLLDVNNEQ